MVEVRIEEMFRDYERAVVVDAEKKEAKENEREKLF